jgi:hypothetical protein
MGRGNAMPFRAAAAFALLLVLGHPATAAGAGRHFSCTVVRFYVAKYSEAAAESYARSRGATDSDIQTARKCLGGSGVQTASFAAK